MIQNKLKDLGLRITPQRMAIVEYLEGNKEHPSVEDIFRAVSKKYPGISIATVYNTLYLLKEKGLIEILEIDPERIRCEPNTDLHHHFICSECKKIFDIFMDIRIEIPEEGLKGFKILGKAVKLFGLCERCQRHSKGSVKDTQKS